MEAKVSGGKGREKAKSTQRASKALLHLFPFFLFFCYLILYLGHLVISAWGFLFGVFFWFSGGGSVVSPPPSHISHQISSISLGGDGREG
ncbi:hypothetical protein LZ30DRAFT_724486 [Colletotrichum cereale]|nr:hypothetical protein LZ30DRAFT_724486 [Colletotrichum cereale]